MQMGCDGAEGVQLCRGCPTVQMVCDGARGYPTVQMGCDSAEGVRWGVTVQRVSNCAGEDDANIFNHEEIIAVLER